MRSVEITVNCKPPVKDPDGYGICGEKHKDDPEVRALVDAVRAANPENEVFASHVKMEVVYHRNDGQMDGVNIIGGVADLIQKRGNNLHGSWLIDDDRNVVEVYYVEEESDRDWYLIRISEQDD